MASVLRVHRGRMRRQRGLGDSWTDSTPVPPLDTSSSPGYTDSGMLDQVVVTANPFPWALIVILAGAAVYFGFLYKKKRGRKLAY